MVYNAGTISFNGNSVTGTGTNFTAPASQIRIGQTLLIASNPVQLVQITAINSATSLTVTPAASPAVNDQRYGIFVTETLSVDGLAQSISQLINEYDENIGAWEAFASTTANQRITVTINGVSMSIPSLGSLEASIGGMAKKGANKDITSLGGLTTALSIEQGGTGAKTLPDAKKALGSDTVNSMTGGTISSPVSINGGVSIITQASSYGDFNFLYPSTLKKMAYAFCENFGDMVFVTTGATVVGTEKYFAMRQNGNFTTQGNISCVSLTQTSDATKKDKIKPIQDPLEKISQIEGVTFNWRDSGLPSAGVIAQQLMEVLPEAIGSVFDDHDRYEQVEEINDQGETVLVNKLVHERDDSKRSYTVEYAGVVALCVQAIKALNEKVGQLERAAADHDQS